MTKLKKWLTTLCVALVLVTCSTVFFACEDGKCEVKFLPSEHVTMYGDGTYQKGETIIIYAQADAGYKFTHWDDLNTDNPRKIVVNDDINITANVTLDEKEEEVVPMNIKISKAYVYAFGDCSIASQDNTGVVTQTQVKQGNDVSLYLQQDSGLSQTVKNLTTQTYVSYFTSFVATEEGRENQFDFYKEMSLSVNFNMGDDQYDKQQEFTFKPEQELNEQSLRSGGEASVSRVFQSKTITIQVVLYFEKIL